MRSLKYLIFAFAISFIALNNVSAEMVTCTYNGKIQDASFTYTVKISDGNIGSISASLDSNGANVIYKQYGNDGTVSDTTSSRTYTMKRTDYLDANKKADCSLVKSIEIDVGWTSTSQIHIYAVGENLSGSIASSVASAGIINYEYTNVETFTLSNNTETGNGAGGSTGSNSEFDIDTFCTGTVQGVFTTLGWVFFFLKILIPIILIVFGSIDFGKAMLSSKDDEIKKSAKTLVMRAIAGIIIFFIPTILSFVVSLFDKDNIYNGTFKNCTQCMLNPKHEFEDGTVCSSLRGN